MSRPLCSPNLEVSAVLTAFQYTNSSVALTHSHRPTVATPSLPPSLGPVVAPPPPRPIRPGRPFRPQHSAGTGLLTQDSHELWSVETIVNRGPEIGAPFPSPRPPPPPSQSQRSSIPSVPCTNSIGMLSDGLGGPWRDSMSHGYALICLSRALQIPDHVDHHCIVAEKQMPCLWFHKTMQNVLSEAANCCAFGQCP